LLGAPALPAVLAIVMPRAARFHRPDSQKFGRDERIGSFETKRSFVE